MAPPSIPISNAVNTLSQRCAAIAARFMRKVDGSGHLCRHTCRHIKKDVPACARIREDMPAGYLTIKGIFAKDHHDELMQLLRHHEQREKNEHPLQRIMQIDE
jgi:Fe-S oxidoreductase